MPSEFSLSLYIYVVDETKVYCELVEQRQIASRQGAEREHTHEMQHD